MTRYFFSFSVNCDRNSSNYSEKEDKHGRDSFQNMEEKTEEVEELGSHGQLCKCGSNSEICEEFINSFSLQDILSNFELPLSSSTDEDDETSSNKKQNEDEEELNLIDFLNNTQFLNDFVNRNSIKLDKVCRNADNVDLFTKNNRKKKNIVEDNHQILHDNQNNDYDNQFLNSDFGNQTDNQDKQLDAEQEGSFMNEESSSEFSVQSDDSQSNLCAKYNFTGQDVTSSIPLPSFDTFKSKNINSQFINAEDNNSKDNIKITLDKCMEMFQKYQNYNEQAQTPKQDDKSLVERHEQSIMGININEQINEFERYTEEPGVLEQISSQNNVDQLSTTSETDKNEDTREKDSSCKEGSQKPSSIEILDNFNLSDDFGGVDKFKQIEKHVNAGKTKNQNATQCMINFNHAVSATSKPATKQFEEVIDSGNFWVTKNSNMNSQTIENESKERNVTTPLKRDSFRIPMANSLNNKFPYGMEREADENNMKKSVKILTKTHLLNSMQFDKNQRHFINSPHFLLLLTKPLKSPIIEGQCFTKNLSVDTKTKLINLQNSIRTQIKNAQLLRNKCKPSEKGPSEICDSDPTPVSLNANVNGEKTNNIIFQENNTQLDVNSNVPFSQNMEVNENHGNQYNCYENIRKDSLAKRNESNNPNTKSEAMQTNCKELCSLINKTENFRFHQELKILTLRTENADCINKKIKPRRINSVDIQAEIKPVSFKTKHKIKPREEKIQQHNNYYVKHQYHQYITHHHHRNQETTKDDENDSSLRRSERIRDKKQKKRLKSCLISNVKKTKFITLKKSVSMSLVDQYVHLKREGVSEQYIDEDSKKSYEEKSDLILYKNCFVEEEIIKGQRIKKLKCLSKTFTGNERIQLTHDPKLSNESIKSYVVDGSASPNVKVDKLDVHANVSKTIFLDDNIEKITEKKHTSLKSKYPALEALIASTSNEVKPIIRKRKRVKFDKSKYEKIKKINKEKENNIEQNKVLLLNLNKNIQNKGMQNLLLIRDHNNKTHLLFTKPIEKDKINLVSDSNMTTEKDQVRKLNENNPNYINKKLEEMREEMVQQKNLNKSDEKSTGSDLSGDPLLTAPNLMNGDEVFIVDGKEIDPSKKVKDIEELNFDLEYTPNVNKETKLDRSNYTFMNHMSQVPSDTEAKDMTPQMHSMKTDKCVNEMDTMTTELSPGNYSCRNEPYNDYGFYSISPEYHVAYGQNIVTNNTNITKSFQTENCSTEPPPQHKFCSEDPGPLFYNHNSDLSIKNNSSMSSMPSKILANNISNRFMKDLETIGENSANNKEGFSHENKNYRRHFENKLNLLSKQNFPTNFMNAFQRTSIWESRNLEYNMDGLNLPGNSNNVPSISMNKSYMKGIATNNHIPNSQYTKNSNSLQSNTFQQFNSRKFTNDQSRTFEHQMVPDVSTQVYLGENTSGNGLENSNSTASESKSVFLDVFVGNTNVKSPVNFTPSGIVQSSSDFQVQNFRPMFGGEESCWNSSDWSDGKCRQDIQMASSGNENYDEHLQLSEEIMKKSLQEDEQVNQYFENV